MCKKSSLKHSINLFATLINTPPLKALYYEEDTTINILSYFLGVKT
jgi:hypothetical protein